MNKEHQNRIAALLNTTPETFEQDFQKAKVELAEAFATLSEAEREEEELREDSGWYDEWLPICKKVRISEAMLDDAKHKMHTFRSLELCGFGG